MGFLDGVIGNVLKTQALGAILGESGQEHAGVLQHLIEVVNSPAIGGLGGLLSHLQSGGLAGAVGSWIGTGANQPVTGQQLQAALPPELLNQLAARTGLGADQISHGLAQVLPKLVNHLTPDGTVPAGGGLQEALGGL
jgi:uncharacterized protein YidB (DUF937 family)